MRKLTTPEIVIATVAAALVAAGSALTSSVVESKDTLHTLQATTDQRLRRIETDIAAIRATLDEIAPRVPRLTP